METINIQPGITREEFMAQVDAAIPISSTPTKITVIVGDLVNEVWAYRPRADCRIIQSLQRTIRGQKGRVFSSIGVKGSQRGIVRKDGFVLDTELIACGRNMETGGIVHSNAKGETRIVRFRRVRSK